MKTLVVFYSRTGNTKRVAEMIAGQLGADLQELMDRKDRGGLFGWLRSGRDAVRGTVAEIKPLSHSPGDYELIVVGTPVWAARPTPAVRAFLQSVDLSGKKVALFCTMNAQGGEEACATMKSLIPGVKVVGQLAVAMKKESGSQIEERVAQWVTQWKGLS